MEHAESCELEVSTYGGDAIHLTHFSKVNVKYAFKLLSFDSSTITARKCMHSSSRCGSSDQEYAIGRLTYHSQTVRCPKDTVRYYNFSRQCSWSSTWKWAYSGSSNRCLSHRSVSGHIFHFSQCYGWSTAWKLTKNRAGAGHRLVDFHHISAEKMLNISHGHVKHFTRCGGYTDRMWLFQPWI